MVKKERRRYARTAIKQKVDLSRDAESVEVGSVVDVSMGGVRVVLDKEIKRGAKLSGQLKILPSLGLFYIKGTVVWVRPFKVGNKKRWEAGVRFGKVDTLFT